MAATNGVEFGGLTAPYYMATVVMTLLQATLAS